MFLSLTLELPFVSGVSSSLRFCLCFDQERATAAELLQDEVTHRLKTDKLFPSLVRSLVRPEGKICFVFCVILAWRTYLNLVPPVFFSNLVLL
jgi:hypothetical protein